MGKYFYGFLTVKTFVKIVWLGLKPGLINQMLRQQFFPAFF